MKNTKRMIGRMGEEIAWRYLIERGYTILTHNYRTKLGEIDLIASSPITEDTVNPRYVFVEVKTRTGRRFGYPEESVTKEKLEHIIAVAQEYIATNDLFANEWQIDIICIEVEKTKQNPKITHWENVTAGMRWDD